MKINTVYNGLPAWQALAQMKKTPQTAYKLMKYYKKVCEVCDIVQEERNAYIKEFSNTKEGEPEGIRPGSENFTKFYEKLNIYLEGDSGLKPYTVLSMDELVSVLDMDKENTISDVQLMALEPFFTPEEEA